MRILLMITLFLVSFTVIAQPPSPVAPSVRALVNDAERKSVIAATEAWLVRKDMSQSERLAQMRILAEGGNYYAQLVLIEVYDAQCGIANNDLCGVVPRDRVEAQKWRYEIAREDRPEIPYFYKSWPQSRLAYDHYYAARPKYDPEDENCKAALVYAKQSYANGYRCIAQLLELMYGLGQCVKVDKEVRSEWSVRSIGCPRY